MPARPVKKTKDRTLPGGLVQYNVRLPRKLLDELDAVLAAMNAAEGWEKYNRSDLFRELVAEGLERRKREAALSVEPGPKKPTGKP